MPSKSYRLKRKKFKFVPKSKKQWQPTRNWLELPSDLMLNILQRVGVIDRLENAQLVCTAWREICKTLPLTMPPKSKSNRRRNKIVQQSTRNWLELPSDIMLNILQRVGVIDRLENAQLVCTAWREICKDPVMWRAVYIDRFAGEYGRKQSQDMCKHAVNRSQGQLIDLTTVGFCDSNLLRYVADRSSQLRRVELVLYFYNDGIWSEVFKKLPLLEELNLVSAKIWKKDIEAAGRYCPLLKTLKVNQEALESWGVDHDPESRIVSMQNELAVSIGKNLPHLTHLELIGNSMTNTGLQAILDGCCHLELLDLRRCIYLDLNGELGKRCSQQIKYLNLPHDSLQGLPYNCYGLYETHSDSAEDY